MWRRKQQEEIPDDWVSEPLDEETIAALKARGARFPTGEPRLDDFEPVKQRPAWLAFLLRLIRYEKWEPDESD
ncbi:hypothetical protein [Longimicrobium sp.]|uniref:hypothetical protein n=1 Tax=Longimicrobium sp. TaxID=2029185 RepID=UPI002C71E925|nr:hypothetical protein [Longimicrobium sp.]HSU14846.1 hypothetical protein [Longimicrobium sp.]